MLTKTSLYRAIFVLMMVVIIVVSTVTGLGNCYQVIAIMSSEPLEVTSCLTSWYYDPFAEQISSSIIGGERMTSSLNIVVIHSIKEPGHQWTVNTTKPQVTLWLFPPLFQSVAGSCYFAELQLLWIGSKQSPWFHLEGTHHFPYCLPYF